ncbi:hypothetical protein [Lactiplantibacillus plantarum]|uniref:hypothetical protein n=1 Tax=Lactiplantibacillus plantarum TaxID=1590 RepID=UPI0035127A2F
MNWTVIIQSVLTFAGGFAAAYWSFKGSVKKASFSNEGIYADKTSDLFERIDKLTNERDDLKEQVMKLQGEVKDLTKAVKEMKQEMKERDK